MNPTFELKTDQWLPFEMTVRLGLERKQEEISRVILRCLSHFYFNFSIYLKIFIIKT